MTYCSSLVCFINKYHITKTC